MRVSRGWGWLVGVGLVAAVGVLLVFAGSATAAFPGHNGLLVVQPLHGRGLVLVDSGGREERRVCTSRSRCGSPTDPRWSPDGRSIVFAFRAPNQVPRVGVVYPDGSCLACQLAIGLGAAFTDHSSLVTVVHDGYLGDDRIDGISNGTVLDGRVSDPAWSAHGMLAVVRSGRVFAGLPAHLRSLGPGGSPSWAPGGSRIAIQRDGWVLVIRLKDGRTRRLVKGSAPAWSPNGRAIAFIAPDHDLSIIPAAGGRARQIGHVKGVEVDWQPLPSPTASRCDAPTGAIEVASTPGSEVTENSGPDVAAYMGCLLSNGRERLLEDITPRVFGGANSVGPVALAGDYAALVNYNVDGRYGGDQNTLALFNLQSGTTVRDRGGESVSCPMFELGCESAMDQIVLGSNGVSAVHTVIRGNGCDCPVEQIIASDRTGVHTLDSVNAPDPSPPELTDLALAGNTLTWEHDGAPESAELTP